MCWLTTLRWETLLKVIRMGCTLGNDMVVCLWGSSPKYSKSNVVIPTSRRAIAVDTCSVMAWI